MKRYILLAALPFLLTGCGIFGTGEAIEYPYAIEDGMFWDAKLWAKTDLTSSESDCFVLRDGEVRDGLREAIAMKQKVRLTFNRHFFVAANCLKDEVTSFEILK